MDNQPTRLEPKGEDELFILNKLKPEQTVRIGRGLLFDLRLKLVELLIKYKESLACSSNDLGVIPREFAEYKLGISIGTKLVFQKKRTFAKQRQEIIRKSEGFIGRRGNKTY